MLAMSWLSVKSADPMITSDPADPLSFPSPDSGSDPPPPHALRASTDVTANAERMARLFMMILLVGRCRGGT
jgi:hypothetical protein